MAFQFFLLCALTFMIHFVGASAYAIRIAGLRTRRIAVSISLFNVLLLVARISTALQAPLLAKRVEANLAAVAAGALERDLRLLLLVASVATIVGVLAVPTSQRAFGKAIEHLGTHRSVLRLVVDALRPGGFLWSGGVFRWPSARNLTGVRRATPLPVSALALNALAQAILTVGVIAALYAGALVPDLRLTSLSLVPAVNGLAVVLMIMMVDPQISGISDDVVEGRVSEAEFRRAIVWLLGARLAGTILAQVALVPAAWLIAAMARGI